MIKCTAALFLKSCAILEHHCLFQCTHIEKKNEEKEDIKVGDELRMGERKWFQSMDRRLDMDNKITIQLSLGDTKFDFTKLATKQEIKSMISE